MRQPQRVSLWDCPHDQWPQVRAKNITLMLEKGADPNERDENGCTPLFFAAIVDNPHAARRLIKVGATLDARDRLGLTPLMCAASVRAPVKAGCNLDAKDHVGETALILAMQPGDPEVVSCLIRKGADVDAIDLLGRSTLMYGAMEFAGQ